MRRNETLLDLTKVVKRFCEERDWDQFHGPKDLAIGIITESSELLEHFRFLTEAQALESLKNRGRKEEIEAELADILFFLLRFAQRFDIDLGKALRRKVRKNVERYPIEKSRGSNKKYPEL